MAKAKKELSLKEKLEQALVADWEQPYAVPENWVWVRLGSLFDITSSKRVHKDDWKKSGIPFYRTRELVKLSKSGYVDNELFITEDMYTDFKKLYGIPQIGDLLVSGVGTIGVPYVISNNSKFYFKDGNIIWLKNITKTNSLMIYYIFKSDFILNQIKSLSSGTTVDTYTIVNAKGTLIPLPPLAEQERIVQRIESLFAKLDTAKERIEASLASFETRKSALLHQAFTGELTRAWRDKHGVSLDSWKKTTLKDVCNKITDGTHKSPQNTHTGEYKYITAKNIKEHGIILKNITFVTKKDFEEIYTRCNAEKGDILYIKDGATTGIATINQLDEPFALLSSVALLKVDKEKALEKYIVYALNSSAVKEKMIDNMSGSAITRLTLTKIKQASLPFPPIPEQKEIVRILDSLLAKEEQAKTQAQKSLDTINHMKQAILARAFRGELGTHDSTDEPAVLLLERILAESMAAQAQKASPSKAPKERKARTKAPALPTLFPQPGREDRVLYLMECLIDEYPNMTMKEIYEMAMLATMPSLWKKLLGKDAAKLTTILQNHTENWKFSVKEKVRPSSIWKTLETYHNVIISEQGLCSLRQGCTSERMESYKKLLPFFYNAYSIFCNERHKYLDMDVKVQKMEWLEHIA